MTYTRKQLEKMSDFEVNKALAAACLKTPWFADNNAVIRRTMTQTIFTFNDWNDIMPLAVEYMIDFLTCGGLCTATSSAHSFFSHHKTDVNYTCDSPQRAIACCLLMMELT